MAEGSQSQLEWAVWDPARPGDGCSFLVLGSVLQHLGLLFLRVSVWLGNTENQPPLLAETLPCPLPTTIHRGIPIATMCAEQKASL